MNAYSFPLAWRWTSPPHSVLPADVMANITPVVPSAREKITLEFLGTPEIINTDCDSNDVVCQWLTNLKIAFDTVVVVQWDQELAVQTKWSIFVQYWDDFCYPSSDDVEVAPITKEWILQYHHEEVFEFRRRLGEPSA